MFHACPKRDEDQRPHHGGKDVVVDEGQRRQDGDDDECQKRQRDTAKLSRPPVHRYSVLNPNMPVGL
jgi:hypothetical protein